VWSYILRRLLAMIPTLFGVTVVAFLVMQLAPGDPLRAELGAAGALGESAQTREAYLIQKRDLKLDRPLILNFNYFRDYAEPIRLAARFEAMSLERIAEELRRVAEAPDEPEHAAALRLLRRLRIAEFDRYLFDPALHEPLARRVRTGVQLYLEDTGVYGAPAAFELLRSATSRRERVGAIRSLNRLVVEPFQYTYSRDASEEETPGVTTAWRLWWGRAQDDFRPLDPDQRAALGGRFQAMVDAPSRAEVFRRLEGFERGDMPFFAEKLLGDSTLAEREIAAAALRLYVVQPLRLDVARDADDETVAQAAENWLAHYELRRADYAPGLLSKLAYVVADTQYAHMCWRLFTFNFGRSATKTREPVSERIWNAVVVSAPLMFMASVTIYLVAVPLGIVCAVNRANWIDRAVSLGLFLLYSIPPFVAGMLFLLFLCYGEFLDWFPSLGLHSPGAEQLGTLAYLADYLHHAFLPVVCLSLFSLAAMAMYSRTSMLDVIGQDYIRTARAKGLSGPRVIFKHGVRNALIPIITLFAGFLPAMLGGSVLIEYLFGIPGMGRLSWDSIQQKDFPTLMALLFINAIVVMVSILITDMLYVLVDPRISLEGRGRSA
jgi:ABC-type dipeptide/oligopeptide/nickel transport system permease component